MGKNDKKGGEKAAAKGKSGGDKEAGGSKAKGAQSINVRHILVRLSHPHAPKAHRVRLTGGLVREACKEGGGAGEAERGRQIRRGGTQLLRGQGEARYAYLDPILPESQAHVVHYTPQEDRSGGRARAAWTPSLKRLRLRWSRAPRAAPR